MRREAVAKAKETEHQLLTRLEPLPRHDAMASLGSAAFTARVESRDDRSAARKAGCFVRKTPDILQTRTTPKVEPDKP